MIDLMGFVLIQVISVRTITLDTGFYCDAKSNNLSRGCEFKKRRRIIKLAFKFHLRHQQILKVISMNEKIISSIDIFESVHNRGSHTASLIAFS